MLVGPVRCHPRSSSTRPYRRRGLDDQFDSQDHRVYTSTYSSSLNRLHLRAVVGIGVGRAGRGYQVGADIRISGRIVHRRHLAFSIVRIDRIQVAVLGGPGVGRRLVDLQAFLRGLAGDGVAVHFVELDSSRAGGERRMLHGHQSACTVGGECGRTRPSAWEQGEGPVHGRRHGAGGDL